jgi:hypothetical protein
LSALTPAGTAWANSDWVELTNSTSDPIGVYAFQFDTTAAAEFELDLGSGAAGSETVLGTVHGYGDGEGREIAVLPAVIPVAAGTRLAMRGRRNSTSAATFQVGALYYGPLTVGSIVGGIALGYRGTVQSSRSVCVSLDGNGNVLNEVGKMKVFGKGEYTQALTVIDPVNDTDAVTKRYCDGNAGGALDDLSDVAIGSPLSDGDVLTYDAGTSAWVNSPASGGASALDDLSDVTMTSPATNDTLTYNGSVWVNQPPSMTFAGFSLLTNGDPTNPELIFDSSGDVIVVI